MSFWTDKHTHIPVALAAFFWQISKQNKSIRKLGNYHRMSRRSRILAARELVSFHKPVSRLATTFPWIEIGIEDRGSVLFFFFPFPSHWVTFNLFYYINIIHARKETTAPETVSLGDDLLPIVSLWPVLCFYRLRFFSRLTDHHYQSAN